MTQLNRTYFLMGAVTAITVSLTACHAVKQPSTAQIQIAPPVKVASQQKPVKKAIYDQQLLAELKADQTNVEKQAKDLYLTLPHFANFAAKSHELNANLQHQLNLVASIMLQSPYTEAVIQIPASTKRINKKLQHQRNQAVLAYLEAQGIPRNRLQTNKMAEVDSEQIAITLHHT